MNKPRAETRVGLEFCGTEHESGITGDGNNRAIRTGKVCGDGPRERDSESLLAVAHEDLSWRVREKVAFHPDKKQSLIHRFTQMIWSNVYKL